MKLINKINPKQLFRPKNSPSVSRSCPSSFSSGSSSSESLKSSSTHHRKSEAGKTTPKSVLPPSTSPEIWSSSSFASSDIYSDLVQAFKMIDKDGDGKITRKELETFFSRAGGSDPPSKEEIAAMLSEVDTDGDGCITLEEFCDISSAFGLPSCDSELKEAFDFFDMDHDGKITAAELQSVFSAIGDQWCTLEDCRRMISGVDKNGDGFVCFEDFSRMMEQQR